MDPDGAAIVTPEAVILDFEVAGISSRGLARSLDALLQLVVLFALLLVAGFLPGTAAVVLAVAGVAAVVLGYPVVCEAVMRGGSPGKAALGLRVVTTEGAPIAVRHAFIRSAVGIVDFLLPPLGFWAVLSSLFTPRSQRLGDLVAGTIVLRERRATGAATAVRFHAPAGTEAYVASLDVTPVTASQLAVIRGFLLRVNDLAPEARSALAARLATPVAASMHQELPVAMGPELFLVCVAAAYQARHAPLPPPRAWAPSVPPPPPPPPPRAGTGWVAR